MLVLTLSPSLSTLGPVRRAVQDWATRAGIDSFAVTVVAAELVTNAIEASPPDRPVELSIRAAGGAIELVVTDHGPGFTPDPRLIDGGGMPGPSHERGRGLPLVRRLSRQLDISRSAGRTVVRSVLDAEPGPPGTSPPAGNERRHARSRHDGQHPAEGQSA